MQRSSGILMHISSLPSPYGIGTLGKAAYEFADFLEAAGQRYWQVLPLGPTSFGDSPYQSCSTFAGNPYFIDLDLLCEDGLLLKEEYADRFWGDDPGKADYGALWENRYDVLRIACSRGWERDQEAVRKFIRENEWVENYALFMAVKQHFGYRSITDWEDDAIRMREPEAVERYSNELRADIDFYIYTQFLFFRQWTALKEYVAEKGILLIGDVPIYVPLDSADVWEHPEGFQLDEQRRPKAVAGVPPDYFSETGQLWGNPLYDWDAMKQDGYRWWMERIRAAHKLFDVIRIDHFRGLASYWRVPCGEETAVNGQWIPGPAKDFVDAVKANFPNLDIIAEDLGFLTEDVMELLAYSGFPGMKVIQFAFNSREPSDYLPHRYSPNCVCYTGTHDNTTAAGWFHEVPKDDAEYAEDYFGLNELEGFNWGMIRGGMSSVADLFVCQMQDYLNLGADARMNTPSTLGGINWRWRVDANDLSPALAGRIFRCTKIYGRAAK
ncbi:MAG: 4-alpha-glucanotransferase [Clostridia bacterium]|nr:4-alpha-glucanotransferase [Clostridia bacterium]